MSLEKDENYFSNHVKKVTLKMIAKEAGVSISCVTRCVNESGYVSEEKRQKVYAVMEKLNYIPNQQAKFLRGGQSKLIGHIHLSTDENILFVKIAATIERKSYERGYKTISYALEEGNKIQMLNEMMNDLLSYGVDGIIVNAGGEKNIIQEVGRKANSISVPVVMIERPADVYEIEKILIDNEEGSYVAVKRLHDNGHKNIAYLGVVQNAPVERERFRGYVQAMMNIHPEYYESHSHFVEEYTVENGYLKTLEIFKEMKKEEYPTAVFAASDILAAGVYRAFLEMGIRIPDQISVVGYDDTIAKFLSPPLSTMQLPVEEIAAAAVETLIKKAEGKERCTGNRTMKIGPVFVERSSIKNIKDE